MTIGNFQWTATIEGRPGIFTDGTASTALTAYSGTSFTAAYTGLEVHLDSVQEIHPYDPFKGGGSCRLVFTGEANGIIGVETHRTNAGDETYLNSTADRNDTTITVLSTADFASSGDAHIGNECFGYSATTATTFTGADRGKYAPFASATDAGNFSQHHRVGLVGPGINIEPLVTQYPRTWKGRWVELVLHHKAGGTLDTRAVAVAAGRRWAFKIVDVDDNEDGNTVIDLEPILDVVREASIFRDQLTAKATEGVYIDDTNNANRFSFRDFINTPNGEDANDLTVTAGYYTVSEIIAEINEWLADEFAAGRLNGNYTWSYNASIDRVLCRWEVNTGANTNQCWWQFWVPTRVAELLGLKDGYAINPTEWTTGQVNGQAQTVYEGDDAYAGQFPPWRILIGSGAGSGSIDNLRNARIGIIENETIGTLVDQSTGTPNSLPWSASQIQQDHGGSSWGMFLVDNRYLCVAQYSASEFTHAYALTLSGVGEDSPKFIGRRMDDETPLEIRQILMLEGPAKTIVKRIFYSTGTSGYNHATHDVYPFGVGLAIPSDLLGTGFINSVDSLPLAEMTIMVVVDKPTRILDLFKSDLILRRAHLVFKSGTLRFVNWSTPSSALAIHTLNEDNKSEPVGHQISHRTVSRRSSEWAKPIAKLQYNRDLATGEYLGTFEVTNRTALDDLGGSGEMVTIPCRNIYGSLALGQPIQEAFAAFASWHAFFSSPIWLVTRSINLSLALSMAPGDVATLTDDFVREQTTGLRGISARPCLVVKVSFSPPAPGKPMVASVVLAMLDLDRVTVYSPCAQFQGTNYNTGNEIDCEAHEHSESSASADASNFVAGDKIRIVEIDPADPADPLTWLRAVESVAGNGIIHDGDELGAGVGEDAFDNTKTYRVISQTYSDAVATQKADAYQADDADARIEDAAPPYQFGDQSVTSAVTLSAHTDLPERHANLAFGDGEPMDTGYQRGLVRMSENLIDHKMAYQTPTLDLTENTSGATGTDWELHSQCEVFLGQTTLATGLARYLYVSTFFRSTDGTSTDLRISLCTEAASGSTLLNVIRNGIVAEQTFTTSSTTRSIPAEAALSLAARPTNGRAWLLVEYKDKCQTRGIAQAILREREFA